MCKELILTWQNPDSREWLPVGHLSKSNEKYQFRYTLTEEEAKSKGFNGLSGIEGFVKSHVSDKIFPLFQNKILNKTRPDREKYLDWLSLEKESYSDFEELARTGGIKVTDNLQLYPVPEKKNGRYKVIFFSHGVSHLISAHKERIKNLTVGEKLFLCKDVQNEQDPNALCLRTNDPVEIIGYCPKFFTKDFSFLLDTEEAIVTVEKVNNDAPDQLKLLCVFESQWPDGFEVFK